MQEIYNDSTDQEVYFDAVDVSGAFAVRLVGSLDGELMTGATVAVKEYKVATASISSPVISWVQALGKWKLVVPVANITQYGYGLIFITKAEIAPVTIEFKTVHDDAYFAGAGAISALELKVDGVGYSVSDAMVEIGEVKTVVDGIATALETPDNFKADVSALATSAQVSALNNISAADVLTQVNAALAAYDAPTKAELDTAIDALPTAAEIVTAIDADVIEGTYTRLQVMRILAAVLAGTRANANDVDTFTGLDGATARVVASVSSTGRTITTLDGD